MAEPGTRHSGARLDFRCSGGCVHAASLAGTRSRAATSIYHQYTNTKAFSSDTTIEPEEAGNSCTDLDSSGTLDRNRIDYIWPSWELDNGSVCRPPLAEAQALIDFASTGTTVSGTGVNRYSDHRAVEAIVNWLPPTPPANVDGVCTI